MDGKTLAEQFFLRPGFERFQLEPEMHRAIMIGDRDRYERDRILYAIEDDAASGEGYKAVIYGDFGRGKTHEAQNLIYEIGRRNVPVVPVYVKCHEFKSKEPFASLFSMMITALRTDRVQEVAEKYQREVKELRQPRLIDVVGSEEIAPVMEALANPNAELVRTAMYWLGGRDVDISNITTQRDPLELSREFAAVLKGFAHMFRVVEKRAIVFFIDEAERLGLIEQKDAQWSWIGCFRALLDLQNVGFVFYAGAKSRDQIPHLLAWQEIVTRIGPQNYRDLLNPSQEQIQQWVLELFQTLVRKGPVPTQHIEALPAEARVDAIPAELAALLKDDAHQRTYPFTPDALDAFILQCRTLELADRPRSVLKRIQTATKRAMRHDRRVVDVGIVEEIGREQEA